MGSLNAAGGDKGRRKITGTFEFALTTFEEMHELDLQRNILGVMNTYGLLQTKEEEIATENPHSTTKYEIAFM